MSATFVFIAMLFMHVLDDYGLQGIMKDLKQKAWWAKQTDDPKYRNDWIPALVCHCVSWSFMIMLPVAAYLDFAVGLPFLVAFLLNVAVHAMVDDLKANRFVINLVQDQTFHLVQIAATFVYFVL